MIDQTYLNSNITSTPFIPSQALVIRNNKRN